MEPENESVPLCCECHSRPVSRFKKQLCKACYNKPYMKKYRSSEKGKEINRISQKRWRGTHNPFANRLTSPISIESIRSGRALPLDGHEHDNYLVDGALPPTSSWSSAQCIFFRVGFVSVKMEEWQTCFSESASMTFEAEMIAASEMGVQQFGEGKHLEKGVPYALAEFGDLIIGVANKGDNIKAATDLLSIYLLRLCNKARSLVLPLLQKNELQVQVGALSYACEPDGGAFLRKIGSKLSVALLHVEDAKSEGPLPYNKEYQITGDMIAAAACNYNQCDLKFAQSIFVVRLRGTYVTFYRLDLPGEYLAGLANGEPPLDLTVFRFGNGDSGFNIAAPGTERKIALEVLCSIMNTCGLIASSLQDSMPSPITKSRIEFLYPEISESSGAAGSSSTTTSITSTTTTSSTSRDDGLVLPTRGAQTAPLPPISRDANSLPLLLLADSSVSASTPSMPHAGGRRGSGSGLGGIMPSAVMMTGSVGNPRFDAPRRTISAPHLLAGVPFAEGTFTGFMPPLSSFNFNDRISRVVGSSNMTNIHPGGQ